MHQILSRKADKLGVSVDQLTPEQWLEDFYANRKGSGKRKAVKDKEAEDA